MADVIGEVVNDLEATARAGRTAKSVGDIFTGDVTSDPALSKSLADNIDSLLDSNLLQLMFGQEVATFIDDKTPIHLHPNSVERTAPFELRTQITSIETEGNMRSAGVSIRIHAEASLYCYQRCDLVVIPPV